ncbi:uncharacterized protein VTP21DRAFT_3499 [Calcarisporiella thermophila]|uniref:uncharacterized protein n=1 Tax=Calcarisporiella thermophila TaxID=911321 RepID=UPI0037433693
MADGQWQTVSNSRQGAHANAGGRKGFGSRGRFRNQLNKSNTREHVESGSSNRGRPTGKHSIGKFSISSELHKKTQEEIATGITAPISPIQHRRSASCSSCSSTASSDFENASKDTMPPYHTICLVHCTFSNCSIEAPITDTTSLTKHLKEQHSIVFKDLHHMYITLDKYLDNWAQIITANGIEKYATKYVQENGDTLYQIDPENSTEDKELREKLQREKLNEILKIQEKERHDDSNLPRKCLFCKNICDNRPNLFRHMFAEHNFNIGLPDNLVNVNEFLNLLEKKLTSLQCLYCEKIFTTPAVLRKHMRKKKHFKIAAKNRLYDQFYVINYLEPGKNWENFENDRYESDEERRDDSWEDWDEALDPEPTMCLFDEVVLPSPEEACRHMSEIHGFDLKKVRRDLELDFYKTITLINYIRHQTSISKCYSCGTVTEDLAKLSHHMKENECFTKIPSHDHEFWKDSKYLFPTYENDPLLTGFENDISDDEFETHSLPVTIEPEDTVREINELEKTLKKAVIDESTAPNKNSESISS